MEHSHEGCQGHGAHVQGKALYRALWIAAFFMLIEVISGIIANSLALISDAAHLFTDVGALGLGLIVVKIAHLPRTPKMSYGYQRAEILGALGSSLALWALCGVLIYEAITRLIHPQPVAGPIVFVVAVIGLIANIVMIRILHPSQGHSLNMRAAYLHVLGDLLGSVGVLLSGLLLWLTHWYPIDPLITLLFSLGILYGSGKVIKHTVSILMESAPAHIDPTAVQSDLSAIPGVKEVHDLHIWSISAKKVALSAHIVAADTHRALREAHLIIEKKYKISHMTLQMEDPEHFEPHYCYDCENLGAPKVEHGIE